ncbi:alpha/beta-hydrolase [Mollisia scopiformis]|uniref:Alpha/beta-hydrolase n=1 Tax=Mollisia scopiformis TaxID=149040 RepID=A0A132BBA0_MOLSC|nr:alpha/beta-hydrolase [Mollisia scopiformis]KUJ09700.1 alpha/beta-hydrolase [Mollisia scopiformis]
MAKENIKLSFSEKVNFFWVLATAPFFVGWVGLRHYLLPPKDSPGVARIVATTLLKTFCRLSQRQMKGMINLPLTGKVIEQYCTKHELAHEVEHLPNNATLHWVGSRPAKRSNVVLYFHGGGYNLPASPEHVVFAALCASEANSSLAMLEYTLAPEGHFPTQLIQAAEALKHILTITPPSRIFIAGDSAGAHLSLSLLSHIMHPLPGVTPIKLSEDLGGICPMSPFLSFDYNKESYDYNAERDYLSLSQVKEFNASFKKPGLTDEEALKDPALSLGDAPAGWWKNCPVDRVLLTMGAWEVFLDDCKAFGERLQSEASPKTMVEVVIGRKEVHAPCLQDTFLKRKDGDSWNAVMNWMSF